MGAAQPAPQPIWGCVVVAYDDGSSRMLEVYADDGHAMLAELDVHRIYTPAVPDRTTATVRLAGRTGQLIGFDGALSQQPAGAAALTERPEDRSHP